MPGENVLTGKEDLAGNAMIFRIFPNPAEELLYIESDQSMHSIEIFNNSGMLVFITRPCSGYSSAINVSHLPQGIYIAKITFNDITVRIEKFVVE